MAQYSTTAAVPLGGMSADDLAVQRRRIIISGLIGTSIEWFDFFLYGFVAPAVFNVLFFPKLDPTVGTIAVLGIYAGGFVARPLGGVFFGHFGDRIGRKPMLYVTLAMMGISTALIGCLPTYASIGVAAPALLTLLRFLQGFAIGGEVPGATILSTETAPDGKRGGFTGLIQAGSGIGALGATFSAAAIAWLPHDAMMSWGWRVPFLISIVLVAVGLYIRKKIIESPIFEQATTRKAPEKVPLVALLKNEPKPALIVFLTAISEGNMLQIFSIFGLVYAITHLGIGREQMLTSMLYGSIIGIFSNILFGRLSDFFGRRATMITSLVLAAFWAAFGYFNLIGTKDSGLIILAVTIPSAILAPMIYSPEGSFYAEIFRDARHRFTGVAVSKQIGSMISGFFPVIAAALLAATGSIWGPLTYYIVLSVISIGALLAARETSREAVGV